MTGRSTRDYVLRANLWLLDVVNDIPLCPFSDQVIYCPYSTRDACCWWLVHLGWSTDIMGYSVMCSGCMSEYVAWLLDWMVPVDTDLCSQGWQEVRRIVLIQFHRLNACAVIGHLRVLRPNRVSSSESIYPTFCMWLLRVYIPNVQLHERYWPSFRISTINLNNTPISIWRKRRWNSSLVRRLPRLVVQLQSSWFNGT